VALIGACSAEPTAPTAGGNDQGGPQFVGEPSNFNVSGCDLVGGPDGDGLYDAQLTFFWTSGQTTTWELRVSGTSTGSKLLLGTDTIGTSYVYNFKVNHPGGTKLRYFWLRSGLTGGGWSDYVGVAGNPINIGGSDCLF
jgi:hypothetical protein